MKPPAPSAEAPPPPADPEAVARLAALAAKTALPPGTRFFCLGDSITAPAPYATKYPELLGKAFAAAGLRGVEVFNAGVNGDDTRKALKRLDADVIARGPTLVSVNLGINDSKLVAPAYAQNFVPLEEFKGNYLEIVRRLTRDAHAEVIVLGTLACVGEWTAAKAYKGPQPMNHFGVPEQLQRYNAAAREAGRAHGCDHVELWEPFHAHPDLKSLFPEGDGVHAGPRGQEFIALHLLRHLVARHPASCP